VKLIRDDWNEDRTFGAIFTDEGERICETLELPPKENRPGVSCIPEGTYLCRYRFSPARKRKVYWVEDVPGRHAIQIHTGNTTADIRGCILVGSRREGNAVRASVVAMSTLMNATKGEDFRLTVERICPKT
jgi:hypothetical protein